MNRIEPFIWIVRWHDFQHYAPDRDRPPAWIKLYTKQLSDDSYLDLTSAQRGLLHDLRLEFARSQYELSTNTTRLSHRLGFKVYTKQLEALNQAGFIRFLSRDSLDLALEQLYASRARDRAHDSEVEVDLEKDSKASNANASLDAAPANGNGTANTQADHARVAAEVTTSLSQAPLAGVAQTESGSAQTQDHEDIPF